MEDRGLPLSSKRSVCRHEKSAACRQDKNLDNKRNFLDCAVHCGMLPRLWPGMATLLLGSTWVTLEISFRGGAYARMQMRAAMKAIPIGEHRYAPRYAGLHSAMYTLPQNGKCGIMPFCSWLIVSSLTMAYSHALSRAVSQKDSAPHLAYIYPRDCAGIFL